LNSVISLHMFISYKVWFNDVICFNYQISVILNHFSYEYILYIENI